MADFLEQVLGDAPVETPVEETPPVQDTPQVEAPVETPADTPPVPAEPADPRAGYVPIDAMLTEREKRQAAERRIADFERQSERPKVPDPFDDPAGHDAYIRQQIENAVQRNRVDTSWTLAVRDYGKEKVEEAKAWALDRAEKDPVFRSQVEAAFTTEALPIDWVVQQHKRDALLSDIGDNVDDWFIREAAKRGYAAQSAPAAVAPVAAIPASRPAAPPRSIASDASPVSSTSSDNPMASLDAIFERR